MNSYRHLSLWSYAFSACVVRLTIAAPLVFTSFSGLIVNVQPASASTVSTRSTIAQNRYERIADNLGHRDDDHHEMHGHEVEPVDHHPDEMHPDEMHHDDMPDEASSEMSGNHDHHDHHEHHGHQPIEVDANQPIPQVSIRVMADSVSGWNLEMSTTNFDLSGATAGQANQPAQGHAHLYANGEKIARVYGTWYHIPHLPSGEVTLEVVLNSNQHQTLTHNDIPIAATQMITVP